MGHLCHVCWVWSSDNDSTSFWPPGSLHTLGADEHICKRDRLFMWIKILCIEYILWEIPTIESTFDVANMVKTATVKDVPINMHFQTYRPVKLMFGKMVSAPLFGSSPNIR